MLKKKAFRKILITSVTSVILLLAYSIPEEKNTIETLKVNKEIEYKDEAKSCIYLLNDDNLLVKVSVLVNDGITLKDKVYFILEKLINNNINPKGLKNIIPKNTKIISVDVDKDYASINFSKELLKTEESLRDKLIEAISYSIFEIDDINSISIYIEDENVSRYFDNVPDRITRDYGINKIYNITSFKDVKKVVLYYISEIDNKNYLVPVTSYVNDDEDKIKIIIESLSSSYIYQTNLVSYLNAKTELINYEINDDIMMLNFNNSIFMGDGNILEEVVYTISNSVFDNYDINKVIFNVDNKVVKEVYKNKKD